MMYHNSTDPRVLDAPRLEPVVVYAQDASTRKTRRRRRGIPTLPASNVPFRGNVARDLIPGEFAARDQARREATHRLFGLLRSERRKGGKR